MACLDFVPAHMKEKTYYIVNPSQVDPEGWSYLLTQFLHFIVKIQSWICFWSLNVLNQGGQSNLEKLLKSERGPNAGCQP